MGHNMILLIIKALFFIINIYTCYNIKDSNLVLDINIYLLFKSPTYAQYAVQLKDNKVIIVPNHINNRYNLNFCLVNILYKRN